MPAFPDNKSVYLFMRWFTFMRKRVKWPLVSALKGREGLLGRPGGGGGLLGHRGGLDEAAVEGVLWVVVGYWEQKTNREAKRSVRGFCTVLLEQQSVLTQSHRGVAERVALSESVEKLFIGFTCELTKAPTLWVFQSECWYFNVALECLHIATVGEKHSQLKRFRKWEEENQTVLREKFSIENQDC